MPRRWWRRAPGRSATGRPVSIFAHLARSFNSSIDGSDIKAPWYFRLMCRFMKKRLLSMPMPAGFTPPGAAGRQIVPPPTSTEEGMELLRSAIARQQVTGTFATSPILGVLTREEWTRLHLNHAAPAHELSGSLEPADRKPAARSG